MMGEPIRLPVTLNHRVMLMRFQRAAFENQRQHQVAKALGWSRHRVARFLRKHPEVGSDFLTYVEGRESFIAREHVAWDKARTDQETAKLSKLKEQWLYQAATKRRTT